MKGIYYFPIAQMEKLRSREGIIRALKEKEVRWPIKALK